MVFFVFCQEWFFKIRSKKCEFIFNFFGGVYDFFKNVNVGLGFVQIVDIWKGLFVFFMKLSYILSFFIEVQLEIEKKLYYVICCFNIFRFVKSL